MGDSFQIIADVEATEVEAAGLARSILAWLTAEGIVRAGASDDHADRAGSRHGPGPRYAAAVTEPDDTLPGVLRALCAADRLQ